jgi:nitrogen fixation NifU-like protein
MGSPYDLYQNTVIDHYRNPRNFRNLPHANRQAEELNPLCGDQILVYLIIENGAIEDISFQGMGCALATASASMMTGHLMGKTEKEALYISDCFHQILARPVDSSIDTAALGDLMVFSSVREYPVRSKCVTLPWKAMRAALEKVQESKSQQQI